MTTNQQDGKNHWRNELNNYLQGPLNNTRKLDWKTSHTGPNHAPTWTAIAYLGGEEWGRGTGPDQGAAKEAAAKEVCAALK